jgi:hypothetical protein
VFDTDNIVEQVSALQADYIRRRAALVGELDHLADDDVRGAAQRAIVHTDLCMVVFNGFVKNLRLAGQKLLADFEDEGTQVQPIIDHMLASTSPPSETEERILANLAGTLRSKQKTHVLRFEATVTMMDKAVAGLSQVLQNRDLGVIQAGVMRVADFVSKLVAGPAFMAADDGAPAIAALIENLDKGADTGQVADNREDTAAPSIDYYTRYAGLLEGWCILVEFAGSLLAAAAPVRIGGKALLDAAVQRVTDKRSALEDEGI